ncbi:MAG: hypothetical protein L0287_22555 [Anaerolineae bacterium]|nr:hypothetical protein [Anaerolineae bacterium]
MSATYKSPTNVAACGFNNPFLGKASVIVAAARIVGAYAIPLVTSNPDGVSNASIGTL